MVSNGRWMPVADWQFLYETVPPSTLRKLELFELYMAKRRKARASAKKYKLPPFDVA